MKRDERQPSSAFSASLPVEHRLTIPCAFPWFPQKVELSWIPPNLPAHRFSMSFLHQGSW